MRRAAPFLALLLAVVPALADDQEKEEQKQLIDMVLVSLNGPDPRSRARNAKVLGDLGFTNDEAISALTKALSDVSGPVRMESVKSLARLTPASVSAVPTLLKLYKAEVDYSIRAEIIVSVGVLAPFSKDALNWLITLAKAPGANPPGFRPRLLAIKALGSLGEQGKPAVPTLIALLNYSASNADPNDLLDEYEQCAKALALIGDSRAMEPLSRHRQGRGVRSQQRDSIIQHADRAARELERLIKK